MIAPQQWSFRTRMCLLVGVCIIALGALPPVPSQAALTQSTIDNPIVYFILGSFKRTVLVPLQHTTASPNRTPTSWPPPGPAGIRV